MYQQNKSKSAQNIKVFARIRPFNDKQNQTESCVHSLTDKFIAIKQKDAKQLHNFTFDGIFPIQSTQQQIYNAVGSQIVASAFDGLNGTIFCYGQTSSGKTFTCIGPDFKSETHSGILPRLIKQTLTRIQQSPKNLEIKMKISMVQIYNQKIKDLLDLSKTDLKIRSNKKQGIFLQNITQKYVLSEEDAFTFLNNGIQSRSVSFTNMNSQSSRSHMAFIINLNVHDVYSGQAKTAKIILVDLAGSEKISKTGAEGKVLEEAKKINTSLTALGKVINALSDGKSTHIPYRDSKLTRLLQESLGGNSLTNLIVNVSPSAYNQLQTISTFRFGQRAKSIKNEPVVNKCYTVEQLISLLKKAQQTIQKQSLLIKQLSCKKRTGGYGAISIPSNITLHMINDQQSTQRSIKFENEDQDLQFFNERQSQSSCQRFKSQQKLQNSLQKGKGSRTLKRQTSLPKKQQQDYDEEDLRLSKFPEQKNQSDDQLPLLKEISQNLENQKKSKKKIFCLPGLQKLPSIIHQDFQQNKTTPRNILHQTNKTDGFVELTETQDHLNKIRQNLFQLKIRYMQQKRENSIKTMIIERKNKIIQKSKNPKLTQLPR